MTTASQVRPTPVRRPPALRDLRQYAVNRPGQIEAIAEPLYDYQTYPTAGASTLTFFQTPVGSGGATLEDTNMRLAGALPSPQQFLVTNIQVDFRPGVAVTTTGTAAVQASDNYANDVETILSRGALRFRVGSKDYLTAFPLMKFPPAHRLFGFAGWAGFASATDAVNATYAQAGGPVFQCTPILLQSTQNFAITLEWPDGAVATPSGIAGRIGLILGGYLYRNSQ